MSIQLALDGHSFSAADLPDAHAAAEGIEVVLTTAKTMLAPVEAVDRSNAQALLAAAGIPVGEDECVVGSTSKEGFVAWTVVPRTLAGMLHERYGEAVDFTSPLLHEVPLQRQCVWILRTGRVLYIKVYDTQLQLAEAIEVSEESDLLYFFERLNAVFPTKTSTLLVAGDEAEALRKRFGKAFKDSLCE